MIGGTYDARTNYFFAVTTIFRYSLARRKKTFWKVVHKYLKYNPIRFDELFV